MKAYRHTCKLMGSGFELCIVDENEENALKNIRYGIDEIKRLEDQLTEFSEESLTSQINKNAGIRSVHVSDDILDLVKRSIQISKLTKGYFDITVSPLKKLYRFKKDQFEMPSKKVIRQALKKIGYHNIRIDENLKSIYLNQSEMKISFAAIGKGFAADVVKKLWLDNGIRSGYINASGDLTAFGTNEKNQAWKIGIANPDQQDQILFYVPLNHASVATSGDYEQHFIYQGERYSHTINPKTGLPLKGIKSISVFSPSAELSDALATAIYAMGKSKGIDFVDQLPKTHAIIIDENNDVTFSKNLNYEVVT